MQDDKIVVIHKLYIKVWLVASKIWLGLWSGNVYGLGCLNHRIWQGLTFECHLLLVKVISSLQTPVGSVSHPKKKLNMSKKNTTWSFHILLVVIPSVQMSHDGDVCPKEMAAFRCKLLKAFTINLWTRPDPSIISQLCLVGN